MDKAIAKAAKTEIRRLMKSKGDKGTARAIENALHSLAGLQNGEIPNYDDEWLAVLYGTWYQPSHINLAYSMIKKMAKRRDPKRAILTRKRKLHVVDFGCGTLAMQFGVTLAAADALQQGQTLTSIKIDLIDSSQPMIDFGLNIWEEFQGEIKKRDELARLREACNLVSIETLTEEDVPAIHPGHDSWMSAMHVVYNDNKEDVQNELHRLSNTTNPHVGFISYHYSSYSLAKSVSPFENKNYQRLITNVPFLFTEPFSNIFSSKLWNVRYDLYDQVEKYVEDKGFVQNYLPGNLPWKPSGADCLIYVRR